jgi:hypothetical protein
MAEVIANAEEIVIGRYRYRPSNLQIFFSVDKAKQFYSEFLRLPISIEYEERSILSRKAESEKGL